MALNLDRNEWFAALMFGVMIDGDHLFAAPRYISSNGFAAILSPTWDDGSGLPWKSLLHYPVGFFVVAPLAVGWRLMLPLIFWSLHLGMDYIQTEEIMYSTPIETVVFVGACSGIFYLMFRTWREARPESSIRDYVIYIKERLSAAFSG